MSRREGEQENFGCTGAYLGLWMTSYRGCCYSSRVGCDKGLDENVSSGKKGVMGVDDQYILDERRLFLWCGSLGVQRKDYFPRWNPRLRMWLEGKLIFGHGDVSVHSDCQVVWDVEDETAEMVYYAARWADKIKSVTTRVSGAVDVLCEAVTV